MTVVNGDTSTHDLSGFFEVLVDAVGVFKHSAQKLPGANFHDCRVVKGKKKKKGSMFFSFLSKREYEVTIEIRLIDLYSNPKEYIESMMDHLDGAMQAMKNHSSTIILPGKQAIH
jgi:hypothetical protein